MPIISFDSLDLVPEGLKDFANTDDGKVTVNVVPNAKLTEFRDRNVQLSQKVEAMEPLLDRYKAIVGEDAEVFTTELTGLRDTAKRVKDGELKTNDEIEATVNERVKAVRDGYEKNAKDLRSESQTFKQRAETLAAELDRTRIAGEITSAVIAPNSGVRAEALPDVLQRAYGVFKIEDGKIVPKNGDATIYGANGADPMTATEWLVKLRDTAPHYFGGNNGGGGGGGKGEKIGGYTSAQIAAMSPLQRLELANAQAGKR